MKFKSSPFCRSSGRRTQRSQPHCGGTLEEFKRSCLHYLLSFLVVEGVGFLCEALAARSVETHKMWVALTPWRPVRMIGSRQCRRRASMRLG